MLFTLISEYFYGIRDTLDSPDIDPNSRLSIGEKIPKPGDIPAVRIQSLCFPVFFLFLQLSPKYLSKFLVYTEQFTQ